jgi:hypothetical protein
MSYQPDSFFNTQSPLYWLSGALAAGIFLVGLLALFAPATGSVMFGRPVTAPEGLAWVRLAGVRDIALGLFLFTAIVLRQARITGILVLLAIVVPVTDCTTVFLATGFSYRMLVHGGAAIFMVGLGSMLVRRSG